MGRPRGLGAAKVIGSVLVALWPTLITATGGRTGGRSILGVLGRRSDGSPLAGRKWPARYAARRIAWHALDHAREMEDRSEPG